MLFSDYPTITQNYFIFCLVACLGVLQWVAARNGKLTLSLLGPWGLGWPGIAVGMVLVVGGFGWFFAFTPGIFEPGLAGGELSTLFAAGSLSALLISRLAGALWLKVGRPKRQTRPRQTEHDQGPSPRIPA